MSFPSGSLPTMSGGWSPSSRERVYPEGPTGNGFCMLFKRAVLDEIGAFDAEGFPRGYGEENDFCMRARAAGWTHLVDDSTYVLHERSASFGEERAALAKAGQQVLEQRWPEYRDLARSFVHGEAMDAAHDAVRVALANPTNVRPRILTVIHAGKGGTPESTRDLIDALDHRFDFLILRSDGNAVELIQRSSDIEQVIANWTFDPPLRATDYHRDDYRSLVAHVLTRYSIELVHIRHLIGHTFDLPQTARSFGIPVVLSFHDFYYVCPTTHLIDDQGVFCGGTCTPGMGRCRIPSPWVRDGMPPLKHSGVFDWRTEVASMLESVDSFVTTTPSVRDLYVGVFPQLGGSRFEIIEHGRELPQHSWDPPRPIPGGPIRILVPGHLGLHKGKQFLAELKAVDRENRLDLHFIGWTDTLSESLGTAHGTYERTEFSNIVSRINPSFVGLFSITAESYSHTLTEAWAMGLPVLATDLGAFKDRISDQGGGWLLDPNNPEVAYRRICAIADDATEYEARRTEALQVRLRTPSEMAVDYEVEYRRLLTPRQSVVTVSEPMRVGVMVVGIPWPSPRLCTRSSPPEILAPGPGRQDRSIRTRAQPVR